MYKLHDKSVKMTIDTCFTKKNIKNPFFLAKCILHTLYLAIRMTCAYKYKKMHPKRIWIKLLFS